MKKIYLIVIGFLSLFIINFQYSQAISLADFTPILDKRVAKMKTTKEKVTFLQTFSDLLTDPTFTKDKDARLFAQIRNYSLNMLNVFEYQLKEENAKSGTKTSSSKTSSKTSSSITNSSTKNTNTKGQSSLKNLPDLSDNFSNIDEDKIREAVLSRHNEERENVGVNAYKYNINLEKSATVRANHLNELGKTSNMHLRKSGDGYYNYNSILERFSDLGIKFPASVGSAASFSESVGYGYYKCNYSDCTDALINAIKKTWTGLIMKEKSYNGDHYRAAVMKHFTQMGAGIAIDKSNNRYYIVLHYGVDF